MDIDEILERAEKVEEKETDGEQGNELLGAFKARYVDSTVNFVVSVLKLIFLLMSSLFLWFGKR